MYPLNRTYNLSAVRKSELMLQSELIKHSTLVHIDMYLFCIYKALLVEKNKIRFNSLRI